MSIDTTLPDITVVGTRSGKTGNFKISDLRNKFIPVRPNLFTAELTLGNDSFLQSIFSKIKDTFEFRIEAAEFPGKTLVVSEVTGGNGPAVKMASDVTYTDISLTVLCSDDFKERTFFDEWMNYIYTERTGNTSSINQRGLFEYYNNYAKSNILSIYQHDSSGVTIYKSTLYEVFPTSISSMTANWDERDTYQRFQVTMAYNRVVNFVY